MNHEIISIEGFEIIGLYTLRVKFADKQIREIDFSPILKGEIYGALKEQSVFKSVRLDPETKTLIWSNGADFDPAMLYRWNDLKCELAARASNWN